MHFVPIRLYEIQLQSIITDKQQQVTHEHTSKDLWRNFRSTTHIKKYSNQCTQVATYHKSTKHNDMGQADRDHLSHLQGVMRPRLKYASTSWSPLASDTDIQKLQGMKNTALGTATG